MRYSAHFANCGSSRDVSPIGTLIPALSLSGLRVSVMALRMSHREDRSGSEMCNRESWLRDDRWCFLDDRCAEFLQSRQIQQNHTSDRRGTEPLKGRICNTFQGDLFQSISTGMDIDGNPSLWCGHQYFCKYKEQETKEANITVVWLAGCSIWVMANHRCRHT